MLLLPRNASRKFQVTPNVWQGACRKTAGLEGGDIMAAVGVIARTPGEAGFWYLLASTWSAPGRVVVSLNPGFTVNSLIFLVSRCRTCDCHTPRTCYRTSYFIFLPTKLLVVTWTSLSFVANCNYFKTLSELLPKPRKRISGIPRKIGQYRKHISSHYCTDPKPFGQFWIAILAEPLRM